MMAQYTNYQELQEQQKKRSAYYKSQSAKNWAISATLLAFVAVLILCVTTAIYYLDKQGVTQDGNYNVHMLERINQETENA